MNILSWFDVAAYLDWAALRPMTELEFEKVCRGPENRIAGEYAWEAIK
jgi:formylglycine-generating enzyme required for sulfatase activity